jgi:hypothetical protein
MQPDRKTLLTAAFEALGPERVARGLEATGHTWNDCFLALALGGQPGVLAHKLEKRWRKEHMVSNLLGVPAPVVTEVVTTWDRDVGTFRALAAEWLESNRVPAAERKELAALAATGV